MPNRDADSSVDSATALWELVRPQLPAPVAALFAGVEGPCHPAGWESLVLTLPSGHRVRVEDIDAWGVIVDTPDGEFWRGQSFHGADGSVLTGDDDLAVVAEHAVAALVELAELDAAARLGEYGVDLRSPAT